MSIFGKFIGTPEERETRAFLKKVKANTLEIHGPLADLSLAIVKATWDSYQGFIKAIKEVGFWSEELLSEGGPTEKQILVFNEFLYFFIHLTIRTAVKQGLTDAQISKLQDYLGPPMSHIVADSFCKHWPAELKMGMAQEFFENLNNAEADYSECRVFMLEDISEKESLFGKLSYNIEQLLGIEGGPAGLRTLVFMLVKKSAGKAFLSMSLDKLIHDIAMVVDRVESDDLAALKDGPWSYVPELREEAEQGNAKAQFRLGLCYVQGQGVRQDYAEAVKWYRKAAEQGNADAQCHLGDSYYTGNGIPQDYVEAVKWYRKAAEQEDADAQCKLGGSYYQGQGVTQNNAEAVKWYRKSAEHGYAAAQYTLGVCYDGACYVRDRSVAEDYTEAAKWYRKAAEQGYAEAQWRLGLSYTEGQGVPQSYTEAVKWLWRAAEQGDPGAQLALFPCFVPGQKASQDYAEEIKAYQKVVEQRPQRDPNSDWGLEV